MDEKVIFYIVLGIVYFIFNALKKKKPEGEVNENIPPSRPDSHKPQPVSFEELLRELTEGKNRQENPSPPVVQQYPERPPFSRQQPTYIDYDDDLEEEERSLEKVSFDDDRTNKVYEEAKKLAFQRPSLEETLKLENVNTTYGRFKEFDVKQEKSPLLEYVKDLRDPKGFKKAFILSEVLNKKHF